MHNYCCQVPFLWEGDYDKYNSRSDRISLATIVESPLENERQGCHVVDMQYSSSPSPSFSTVCIAIFFPGAGMNVVYLPLNFSFIDMIFQEVRYVLNLLLHSHESFLSVLPHLRISNPPKSIKSLPFLKLWEWRSIWSIFVTPQLFYEVLML